LAGTSLETHADWHTQWSDNTGITLR